MKRLLTIPWAVTKFAAKLSWLLTKGVFLGSFSLLGFALRGLAMFMDAAEDAAMWIIKVSIAVAILSMLVGAAMSARSSIFAFERVDTQLPPLKMSEVVKNEKQVHNPMIRLMAGDEFRCSATVISDVYALTAAHCVTGPGGRMNQDPITIKNNKNEVTGVTAQAVAMSKAQDIALLKGDFTTFQKVPIETDPRGILAHQGPFVACGFPGGDGPICTPFEPISNSEFLVYGKGFLYQGMSGGPVLDSRTGQLVAVNSRVNQSGVSVGPTVGFLASAKVAIEQ